MDQMALQDWLFHEILASDWYFHETLDSDWLFHEILASDWLTQEIQASDWWKSELEQFEPLSVDSEPIVVCSCYNNLSHSQRVTNSSSLFLSIPTCRPWIKVANFPTYKCSIKTG